MTPEKWAAVVVAVLTAFGGGAAVMQGGASQEHWRVERMERDNERLRGEVSNLNRKLNRCRARPR